MGVTSLVDVNVATGVEGGVGVEVKTQPTAAVISTAVAISSKPLRFITKMLFILLLLGTTSTNSESHGTGLVSIHRYYFYCGPCAKFKWTIATDYDSI